MSPVLKTFFLFLLSIKITIAGVPFDMKQAETPEELQKGLMFVSKMPENEGMIFPISPPQTPYFWMKNTLIPLDLIFVDKDHKISGIIENTRPLSEKSLAGPENTHYVIEINGGLSAKKGFKIGDKVEGLRK